MKKTFHSHRPVLLVPIVLLIGAACLCNPGGLFPATPTQSSSQPQPEPTAAQVVPVPQGDDTDGGGPWLLLAGTQGVSLLNTDGSGWRQFTSEDFWQGSLASAVQPGGTLLAVVTSAGDQVHNLTLDLLRLPGGEVIRRIPLTTPATEPGADFMPGDPSFEAVRAVMMSPNLAWSPDGSRLAFIGVLDGPSAEVYLYDLTDDAIRRVSSDEAQNFNPAFSLDGAHLLYFGAASFGTGAGFSMTGVWSAYGDGANVTWLYVPDSSGEELIGWRDDHTAVLASWNPVCGSAQLRLYDIETGAMELLYADCFGSAAASNWGGGGSQAVLFTTPEGVFLLPDNDSQVQQISEMLAHNVRWDAGGAFIIPFIEMPWMSISPDGTLRVQAPATVDNAATFGLIWAWTNAQGELPGVWIGGTGMELGQIFYANAYAPAWDENDNTLFFVNVNSGGAMLYRATFPAYNDAIEISTLPEVPDEMIWVEGD